MSKDPDQTWQSTDESPPVSSGADPFEVGVDRYEDAALLGKGALGRVIATRDRVLDRLVARKELIRDEPAFVERFVHEARVTAGLEHPAIPPVYEAGRLADGTPYYTMKRVVGRSLKAAIGEATSLQQRLGLVDAVLRCVQAVAYAHDQGFLHRDLKPDNVMLGRFGETWVVDWGLAQPVGAPSRGVAGTPGFMSPEQARGEPVGPPSDVWSLGALLHAVVAGRRPFGDLPAKEALEQVQQRAPPPIRDVEPDVPGELAAIVDKSLSFRANDRYPDAGALAADLEAWTTGRRVDAYAYSPWQVLRHEAWRHRWRLAAGLGLLCLLLGAFLEADRRERIGTRRALEAERRERNTAQRALAESLSSRGQTALREGDVLLAGAEGAVALRYAELPEARGLVARWLASGAPHPVEQLEAGGSCRWIGTFDDRVACGTDTELVLFRAGRPVWRQPHRVSRAQFSPDGTRLAAVTSEEQGSVRRIYDVTDGTEVWEEPQARPALAVAWVEGRPVWGDGGSITDGVHSELVCSSTVTGMVVGPGGSLQVLCLSGARSLHDPGDLHRLRADPSLGVGYTLDADAQNVWFGAARSIRRVDAQGVYGSPLPAGGYVSSLSHAPDGSWLVVTTDRVEARWIPLVDDLPPYALPTGGIRTGAAFARDGSLWASGSRGPVRWSPPAPSPLSRLSGVSSLQPIGTDVVVVATDDGRVICLRVSSGERVEVYGEGQRAMLAPFGGDRVLVLRRSAGEARWVKEDCAVSPAVAPPVHWIAVGGTRTGVVFDDPTDGSTLVADESMVVTGRTTGGVDVVDGRPYRIEGRTLYELSPTTLEVSRTVSLEDPNGEPRLGRGSTALAMDPDGSWYFRYATAGGVVVVRADGTSSRILEGGAVTADVLADGRLAVGDWDGTVRVLEGDRIVAVLPGRGGRAASTYALGAQLVTTDWDGHATTWDLSALSTPPDTLWPRVSAETGMDWVDGRLVAR